MLYRTRLATWCTRLVFERSISDLPDVSSNDILDNESFQKNFLTPLMKTLHSAVVFLQDKLHMDDFTKYADVYSVESTGGAFKNIKNLMEENFSLELPQVANVSSAVEELSRSYAGATHSVNSAEELDKLDLSQDQPFLLMVHLSSTAENVNEEDAIAKNDDLIGSVCKHLIKRSIRYTAMFTGEKASNGMVEEGDVHSGRHLLEDLEDADSNFNGTLMNITQDNANALLFMKTVQVCVKTDPKKPCARTYNILPLETSAENSTLTNNTASIKLEFPKQKENQTGSISDIELTMDAVNQKDRWIITRVQLSVTPKPQDSNLTIENANMTNRALDLVVPILYSFHCTELKFFLDTTTKTYKEYMGSYIKITGFQFQPFMVQNDRFFNSVDCVGFFTIGIWMGLFPVVLLLSILIGGTLMLLNLSIMDKYDDPKGKTISVPVGND